MSKYFIIVILIMAVAIAGCKKNKYENTNPNHPSNPKKWMVTTVAGDGIYGFADGASLTAEFNAPNDVVVTPAGVIYVADFKNHRIRKIADGQVSTVAGNDTFGIVNGHGALAQFANPYRLAYDAANNLYVVDAMDPRIRKISAASDVTTFAGIAMPGFLDGGVSIARFQLNEGGIVTDVNGNVYVGDYANFRIRKISTTGEVSTIAGSGVAGFKNGDGTTAQFNYPDGIAFDQRGNLYVSDLANYCIRKITAQGSVSKFAGSGISGKTDGDAQKAQFKSISDMVADTLGNLYVIDANTIRMITPQGIVSTIAGSTETYGYADGDGAAARFAGLNGLAIDAHRNIYTADINNNRIRKISYQ